MRIKSLTLRGFKSFASATTFDFGEHINILVGPNGSGKSNVVDALSWVMGEQGAKNLRGGSMKDLIFAGTGTRPALGRAKVSLVLDNSDSSHPNAFSEIKISRTVFNSGGSEYEINGASARLSDVQELLGETGLGKSMHSVVNQGYIDRVLHATATTRRELIEEAAGITVHRTKVAAAERTLESLKTNLDRLEDVEHELTAQLEPLGAKALAVESARELQARLRSLQMELWGHQAHQLHEQWQKADQELAAYQLQQQEVENGISNGEQELIEIDRRTAQAQERIESEQKQLAALKEILAELESTQAVAAERQMTENPLDQQTSQQQVATAQQNVHAEQEKHKNWLEQSRLKTSELETAEKTYAALIQKHQELSEQLLSLKKAQEQREKNITDRTAQLALARAGFERAHKESEERTQEYERASSTALELKDRVELSTRAQESAQAAYKKMAEKAEVAHQNRQKMTQELQEIQEESNRAELEFQSLSSSIATLKESLPKTQEQPTFDYLPLYRRISIAPGWEKAINTALYSLQNALTLADGRNLAAENISLIFDPALETPSTPASPKLPKALTPARAVLTTDPELENAIYLALTGFYVFRAEEADISQIQQFLNQTPEATAIDEQGTSYTAYSRIQATHTQGALEIQARLQRAEQEHKRAKKHADSLAQKESAQNKKLAQARDDERRTAQLKGALAAELSSQNAQTAAEIARQESNEENLTFLAQRANSAQENLHTAQKELAQATQALDETVETPKFSTAELTHALKEAQEKCDAQKMLIARISSDTVHAQENLTESAIRLERSQQNLQVAQEAHQTVLANLIANNTRRQQAQRIGRRARLVAESVHKAQEETLVKITQAKAARAQLHDQKNQCTQMLLSLRSKSQAGQQDLAQASIARAKIDVSVSALQATVDRETGEELDAVRKKFETTVQQNFDHNQSTAQLIHTQKQLAQLGEINPLALEEFNALTDRHAYLRDQIKDLKASRADVHALIKELNTRINTEFSAAFETTREHYQRVFTELFPQGEGTLTLTDPTNLLETGIDISARPAGKKVQRISLLSGGERSLASLALLTAIFLARPTPFYVLDEVEAALDDRNLTRVLSVFQELATVSQLIIITHKPRTIEIADTAYGISMREGASTVVSTDLATLRNQLETH